MDAKSSEYMYVDNACVDVTETVKHQALGSLLNE